MTKQDTKNTLAKRMKQLENSVAELQKLFIQQMDMMNAMMNIVETLNKPKVPNLTYGTSSPEVADYVDRLNSVDENGDAFYGKILQEIRSK